MSHEDILILHDTVQQVRGSETAQWKPAEVLVVSRADGFEGEAVAFAESLGIECYERTASGFELRRSA